MRLTHRVNTSRKFGEALCYYHAVVKYPYGETSDALFTEHEVAHAVIRATRQPEDVPQKARTLWQRVAKWFS